MNLLIQIDENSGDPLYKQIVEAIADMVASGKLAPGMRLPSSREQAEFLCVSRWTVDRAYEELIRRRVIECRPAVGTFVCEKQISFEPPPGSTKETCRLSPRVVPCLSDYGARLASTDGTEAISVDPVANSFAAPVTELLPVNKWRELMSKTSRTSVPFSSSFAHVVGDQRLREALRDYLARTRGVQCDSQQIVIFPGTEPALELVARLFVNQGQEVLVEDPGFPGARRVFAAQGIQITPMPIDAEGLQVHKLFQRDHARLLYVTPSHQDPTGVAMPLNRRLELLKFAHKSGCIILEDDFDNEFHYGRPLSSLQALDPGGSVIYMSSFWKVMYPLVHLGFLVVPPPLVPIFQRAKSQIELDFYSLEQSVLAEFIAEGHLERHVRHTRSLLMARRRAIVSSLLRHLAGKVRLATVGGGTHVVLRFPAQTASDADILRCACEAGLAMVSTAPYYHSSPVAGEFLLSFARLDEAKIDASVCRFATLLAPTAPNSDRLAMPVNADFSAYASWRW